MNNRPAIPPDGTPDTNRDRLLQALAHGGDDTNQEFLFSTTHTTLLQAIEVGLVDPAHLAHRELVRRGVDVGGAGCRAHEVHSDTPATDGAEPEADTAAQHAVAEIARKILRLDTIETRNSDGLDFHELAVWSIRDALTAAYEAGAQAARRSTTKQEG